MSLIKEKSCGCIILKDDKVLLVYEKSGKFWGFPKGHMEDGETEIQTALREVNEEVGLDVEIDETKKYTINYNIKNEVNKTVVLYIAKPINTDIKKQESEIENIKWCNYAKAIETLTFDDWKEMFKNVVKDLNIK